MKRGRRIHGRILAVWEEQLGTELTADAAAGATVLHVDDVSPFNDDDEEPGGWLQVGDQVIEYTTVDDDASTITLATALTTTVTADGDQPEVWVWNDLYDQLDTVQMAQVMPDGKRDQADAIEAVVSDLVTGLANGDRGRPRESCLLERDGDEWELVKVRGRPSRSRGHKWEADDVHVITTGEALAGVAAPRLSHRPIDESIDAKWNGLGQQPAAYTVDYLGQTVTWPLDGFEKAGDRLMFHYEYLEEIVAPPVPRDPGSDPVFVGGWADRGSTTAEGRVAGVQVGDLVIKAGFGDVDRSLGTGATYTTLYEDNAVGPDEWGVGTPNPDMIPPSTRARLVYKYLQASDIDGSGGLTTGISSTGVVAGSVMVFRNARIGAFTSHQGRAMSSGVSFAASLPTWDGTSPTPNGETTTPNAFVVYLANVGVIKAWNPEVWFDPAVTGNENVVQVDKDDQGYMGAACAYERMPEPGAFPMRTYIVDDWQSHICWSVAVEGLE